MSETEVRLLLLATRREQLVLQAQRQRLQLAQAVEPLARSWVWVERGLGVWRVLRGHPWLVALPLAVVVLWRPRGVLRAAAGVATLWRTARSTRRWFGATPRP